VSSTIEAKSVRLLADGRVLVTLADRDHAVVDVRGDHGCYEVHVHGGLAVCPCPARVACSHERAALLVARRTRR
jgi:hypothetical protein